MKHIIYIITALILGTAGIQAQRRDFPALQITLRDGTKDTLFIGTNGYLSMYGLNNATCEDYLKINGDLYFSYNYFNYFNVSGWNPYRFTNYGLEAGSEEGYGIIVSDTPIDDNKSIKEIGASPKGADCKEGGCLYINDGKEQWFNYNYHEFDFYDIDYKNALSLKFGATYYWRPYYILDGKTYLGKEKAVRCPKPMSYILAQENKWAIENFAFNNEDEVLNKLIQQYGNTSAYLDSINKKHFLYYCHSLTEEQIAAAATRAEVCDDGTLYFMDLPDSEVEKLIAAIDAEGSTPFYVQGNNTTTVFIATKTTKIVTCDEKWGVRDNQYITSDTLNYITARPDVYVKLNHVMLPGKTYNITVTIAPQTDETKEIKPLYMRFDISKMDYDDKTFTKVPSSNRNLVRLNVPEAENVKADIIAEGDKLNSIIVQYTPEQFVYYNAFAVSHTKSFLNANSRNKYEQHIRLVGVEVTPAE